MSRIQASRQSRSGTVAISDRHGVAATAGVAMLQTRDATAEAVTPQAQPIAAEARGNALVGLRKQTDQSTSNAEKQSPSGVGTADGLFVKNGLDISVHPALAVDILFPG